MLLRISGVGKICKKRFGAQIHSHELKKKRLSIIYIYIEKINPTNTQWLKSGPMWMWFAYYFNYSMVSQNRLPIVHEFNHWGKLNVKF